MSASSPGRAVGAGGEALRGARERAGEQLGRARGVGALPGELRDDPACAVGVVEREPALEPGAEDDDVVAARACRGRRAPQVRAGTRSAPSRTRAAAVRIVEVPFVVERISVGAAGPAANSRGEAPTSKPSTTTPFRSPPTTASSPSSARSAVASSISRQQSTRSYPAASACAIDEVARITSTTIPTRAASCVGGCEGDIDRHPDTLVRWSPSRGTATGIPTARQGSRARNAVARSVTSA